MSETIEQVEPKATALVDHLSARLGDLLTYAMDIAMGARIVGRRMTDEEEFEVELACHDADILAARIQRLDAFAKEMQ